MEGPGFGTGDALLILALETSCDETAAALVEDGHIRSNVGAIRLYERLGFRGRGIRRAYYTDNREDALIMWRDADQAAEKATGA